MQRMRLGLLSLASAAMAFLAGAASAAAAADQANPGPRRPNGSSLPNIVFILADDQGWGDLGCYGNKLLRTPNVDRLATQGTRFTDCYSGSAVCAPTRCALMTGLHTGHCRRRDNEASGARDTFQGRPLVPLEAGDVTVAEVLKKAGYATGGFGKWGLGNPGTPGTPERHGFDEFYGYYDQVHAHDYYTDYLIRNGERVEIVANKGGRKGAYSHDLIEAESLKFIRDNKDRPFFAYLCYTLPHGNFVVPSDAPYSDQPWTQQVKNYAAMITRLDGSVGRVMALLHELGLEENTIVFYTSDNGPLPAFTRVLGSAGPFRGIKRELYEGGTRCPMIVRWPGKVPAGGVSDFAWWQVDFFPTACELAGVAPPPGLDGMSVLPTLLGREQKPREFFYWEIFDPAFQQAVRMGKWKGLRHGTKEPLELYDLSADPAEKQSVAAQHPDIVKQIEDRMAASHVDTKYWPTVDKAQPRPAGRGRGRGNRAGQAGGGAE